MKLVQCPSAVELTARVPPLSRRAPSYRTTVAPRLPIAVIAFCTWVACGGSATSDALITADAGSSSNFDGDAASAADAYQPPQGDASSPDTSVAAAEDGPASHGACTTQLGNALTTSHGRLDGFLVSIVPANAKACNADSAHLHLQIQVSGKAYDVAVNVDALHAETDAGLPDGAWVEGWHPGKALDYVSQLGVHSNAFVQSTTAALEQSLSSALASANHISVFATGYGPDGVHLVHRSKGSTPGMDGALVIYPLSARAHLFLFRFSDQSF